MQHFTMALEEIVPAFGVAEDDLKMCVRSGLYDWGVEFGTVQRACRRLVRQVQTSTDTPLLTLLLKGGAGCGKTALACQTALDSGFGYVKLVSPESLIGLGESNKANEIARVFDDAYKSPLSLIVLDNLERLLDYVPMGPRFSNTVLQCLLVLLKKAPPKAGHRLLIVATSGQRAMLDDLTLLSAFHVVLHTPAISQPDHVKRVFAEMALAVERQELDRIAAACPLPVGVKQLLLWIEMARSDQQPVTLERFRECTDTTAAFCPSV